MKNILLISLLICSWNLILAQANNVPDRTEGEGPFSKLIIRGATLINSTGAPAQGPVDIVIEKNIIKDIVVVGYPGVPTNESRRPKAAADDKELDATGKFVLPGFVDMHGHIGSERSTPAEYVYKLWMAHGITTIREPSAGRGID
jgi:adenine deaminase